ncbi:(2Fe-2S)-binding protein [bacterium]|nr:MAG: (2Fe-2S)-binding protein [bacterium]
MRKRRPVVTRCICANVSFADLLRLARERGWNFAELTEQTGATLGCGMCLPYVVRMLQTGETSFDVMDVPNCDDW